MNTSVNVEDDAMMFALRFFALTAAAVLAGLKRGAPVHLALVLGRVFGEAFDRSVA